MTDATPEVTELIDPQAEQIVLGSILRLGSPAYNSALETGLQPEHFGIGKHAFVFRTMADLVSSGREPSIGEMADEIGIRAQLHTVDGISGLLALEENALLGGLATGFARTIRRKALHRRAYALNDAIGGLIRSGSSPDEICKLAGGLQAVYQELDLRAGAETFEECLKDVGGFDALLSPPAGLIPFPFDSPIRGIAPGQLVVIGGRSSMGKTILGCHAALHAAGCGFRTLLVSLEMGRGEMLRRLLAMVGKVRHADLQNGELTCSQREAVNRAAQTLADWPLRIVTEPNTLEGIAAKIAAARRNGRAYELVVIDYLGLVRTGGRFENRNVEVGHISRTLKLLAMENELPIVALSQLNRAGDARAGDHEPQLSDLRDSGSIEQDADVVAFIHRPGYFRPHDPGLRNEAKFIVRKQRNGPVGSIDLVFLPEFVSFARPGELS